MLLSKTEILYHQSRGNIVIEPFSRENLGSAQYDVTLGEHCYREAQIGEAVYNPYDEKQVLRKWSIDRAVRHRDLVEEREWTPFANVHPDDKLILVEPGETILAHTQEFIGGACNHITTMMKARSTMGRNFFEVCKCAGMGDIGYFNRWTMEITNNSRYHTIPLVVGRRVAQLLFFQVAPVDAADMYQRGGKYQTSSDLAEIMKEWSPDKMLPKQWRDRECGGAR